MFEAEKLGLQAIGGTGTVSTPAVYYCGPLLNDACLVLEYIEPGTASPKAMALLGAQLATLHQQSNESFGWRSDNFIGSLPQSNQEHNDWPVFYTRERLLPQLQLAVEAALLNSGDIPATEDIIRVLEGCCGDIQPSLVHGDLWGGNFLVDTNDTPFLIDPAVYFGHGEVDLAMSRLFGGFQTVFYETYRETWKKDGGEKQREELYQLYYLLVHLNLFGSSYKQAVTRILKRYF